MCKGSLKINSKLIARVKEIHYQTLGRKLINSASGSNVFWSTFINLVDRKKPRILQLLENGLLFSSFESKVETSSTLPQILADEIPTLQSCEINRIKVLNHIRNLDTSKSRDCDDLLVAMIKL